MFWNYSGVWNSYGLRWQTEREKDPRTTLQFASRTLLDIQCKPDNIRNITTVFPFVFWIILIQTVIFS